MQRCLVVNADDFGLSDGVNQGIIEAAEHGILTSASLMVRQSAAVAAAAYASRGERISVGLHLDLGEWTYRNEEWVPLYSVVPLDNDPAVASEISRQLAEFRRLVGRNPSHLDSHQHVHRNEPVRSYLAKIACQLSIPMREYSPGIHYCGDFYGQTAEGEPMRDVLNVGGLKRILAALPSGITELGCHPGYADGLVTMYRREREMETRVLCAPEVREALAAMHIELCSFDDVSRRLAARWRESRPGYSYAGDGHQRSRMG